MRKLYFASLLLFGSFINIYAQGTTPTGSSTEVGVTSGAVSVSLSGGANYEIPIAVPPGINGVVPQLALAYNSLAGNGIAGYGWNISGMSSITRIESTMYHDGVIDPVDYDNLDRYSLDGQRLILKSGTYGGTESEYQTESFNNVKITSYGVSPLGAAYGPNYFIVQYPDGSKGYYGLGTNTYSRNEWALVYWENPQGVRISYTYTLSSNNLLLVRISYGMVGTAAPINNIWFSYKTRTRQEQAYVGGNSMVVSSILDQIKVDGNGVGYRNYVLEYNTTTLGYQRLTGITEKSGDNSKSYNPTKFTYDDTPESFTFDNTVTDLNGVDDITYLNSASVTGDFDGDNKVDFILYPTLGTNAYKKYYYFRDLQPTSLLQVPTYTPGEFHTIYASNFLTGNSTVGYTLFPNQGYTIVKTVGSTLYITTSGFQPSANGPVQQDEKTVSHSSIGGNVPKAYYTGDFNGDGLTDIITIVKSSGAAYFLNPDKRLTTINTTLGNLSGGAIGSSDYVAVVDFNGDGKSDIMQVKSGKVNIYSLNGTNNGLVLLGTYNDATLSPANPILIGDYNGDGKSDFITATTYGTFFSKYLSTGASYAKTSQTYEITYAESMVNNSGCSFIAHIIPTDFNGDGKTDLVYVENQGCTESTSYIYAKYYKNTGTNFVYANGASTDWQTYVGQYAQPIFLKSNKLVSGSEMSFLTKDRVIRFVSNKDFAKETLLRTATIGNGVKETITYAPLKKCGTGCVSNYLLTDRAPENFPNFDIQGNSSHYVVSLLENDSDAGYRKQIYRYMGAVSNFEGRGFLGFNAISTTNWHQDSSQMVTNVSVYDLAAAGQLSASYTTLGYGLLSTVSPPSTFISKMVNVNEYYLYGNKVFNARNQKKTVYNGLKGTSVETATYYDDYSNPGSIHIGEYSGTTPHRILGIYYTYDNQPGGSTYIIGRPTKKSTEAYGMTQITTEENYSYTNNLLTQYKRKGTDTEYVTEDFLYDSFGNVIKKTLSAPNMASRVVEYGYDTTGRFRTSSKDVEGITDFYFYDTSKGLLTGITDSFGMSTQYFYDVWGKQNKVTDYLGKNVVTTYTAQSGGRFSVTKTGDDGSQEIADFDNLGRAIKGTVKLFDGSTTSTDREYDIYNRTTKISEPYLSSGNASLYTLTEYDEYGRVKKVTEPSGKISNISYSGLTTTVNDGVKTTVTTNDALGNVASLTDEGGTINYQYYPDNNLKQSEYDGTIIALEQNGWGQKTKLTDPAAGVYTYQYDNFGQLTTEVTPKGQRTYAYDDFGKIESKQYNENNSEGSTTDYFYNPDDKLIASERTTSADGNYLQYVYYSYDPYKRLQEHREDHTYTQGGDNQMYKKTYSYDAFGRVDLETSYASAASQESTVIVKNWYQNGYLYKMTDPTGTTNVWEANTVNERGQLLTGSVGPIAVSKSYDDYGFPRQTDYVRSVSGTFINILKTVTIFDAQRGNLSSRRHTSLSSGPQYEYFQYDNLDRLTQFTNAAGDFENQTYDTKGRVTENALGTYEYTNPAKKYQQTGADLTEKGKAYYYNREGIYQETMEQKSGWPTSTTVAYDTAKAFSGTYSLKVTNTATTEKKVASRKSINISNAVITNYTISGWVYSEGPAAQIHLVMGTGGSAPTDFATTTATGQWTYITKTVAVAPTVTVLSVRLDNESTGNVWFDDIKIVRNADATATRELNITYNMNNTPLEINETGVDRYSFEYDGDNNRTAMFYGSMATDKFARPNQKYYATAVGDMEIKHNKVTNEIEFITYIGGSAYDAPAVFIKKSTNPDGEMFYLLRDYQGSILQIVSSNGVTVESRMFDAWGAVIKVTTSSSTIERNQFVILDRGYTGHEHLFSVGLINMNARLYDPKLHRFLSPDNYIQNPYSTQSYNRYGYVFNNPLRYVDYSGNTTESGGENDPFKWAIQGIAAGIAAIGTSWDSLGMKEWFNGPFSDAYKESVHFMGRNFDSAVRDIGHVFDQLGRGIDRLLNGNGPEHYKVTLKAPGFSGFINTIGWRQSDFRIPRPVRQMGSVLAGGINAFLSDMAWGAFRLNPENYEDEKYVRYGMMAGDFLALLASGLEFTTGFGAGVGGVVAFIPSGGTSSFVIAGGGEMMAHSIGSGYVSAKNLFGGIADYMSKSGDRNSNSGNSGGSGNYKKLNSHGDANNYAKSKGYKDAHDLKDAYDVGSDFDIFVDSKTGDGVLRNKSQTIEIQIH